MARPGEPALPPRGRDGEPCHRCATPLAGDQRYCLACGARRGAGGPIDFAALLHPAATAPAPAAIARRRPTAARGAVAATMLVTLLLSGIALGSLGPQDAAGIPGGRIALAVAPPPLTATVPAPATGATVPIVPAPPAPPVTNEPVVPPPVGGDAPPIGSSSEPTPRAGDEPATAEETSGDDVPPIRHVFVIMLAEQARPSAFDAAGAAPYLSRTLVPQGTLLTHLRTVSASGLANSIALLSGQAPNPQTVAGCPTYSDMTPATIGKDGQEEGAGCVYSVQTATLATQLEQAGRTWRAYVEDQGNGGPGAPATCRHPEVGAPDPWRAPRPGDAYETARNPFVYFHAITDAESCASSVVGLDELAGDLALTSAEAPTLSYIVPSACNDGRPAPCAPGAPAGPAAADAFLARVVPKIRAAKAYEDALLIVTFDRPAAPPAIAAGAPAPAYPVPPAADRGGTVGALLLSPFVRKARTIGGSRDTYTLLATIERILGLDPLGKAAQPFGPGLFDAP